MRTRIVLIVVLLLTAARWGTLAALVYSSPETADDEAHLLFGPARLANDFPRLYLPALESGLARFVFGELLWIAVGAAAGFVLASIVRSARNAR